MKLTAEQWQALRYISRQTGLIWGGVYERAGDEDLAILTDRGLIERVDRPYTVGRATFAGGYRITPAGRSALSQSKEG